MYTLKILFNSDGNAIAPYEISQKIDDFKYNDAVQIIIRDSNLLKSDGEAFIQCAAKILTNFKMTRTGPFKGLKIDENGKVNSKDVLRCCWDEIGNELLAIRRSISESSYSRDRYLLELSGYERRKLVAKIWTMTKQLLPFTMVETTFGLVGSSKILFSVLPEIVLPVDNSQWLHVFKTVDLGDIISGMVFEIQHWEKVTGEKLNEMDPKKKLTTLPSVYNVMAMAARP